MLLKMMKRAFQTERDTSKKKILEDTELTRIIVQIQYTLILYLHGTHMIHIFSMKSIKQHNNYINVVSDRQYKKR